MNQLTLYSHSDLVVENDRLSVECEQLGQAVTSHAIVDQAIGAVVVLGQMPPEEAWRALRDVSQRTNTKLRVVAEHVMEFVQGGDLPDAERVELQQAIARYTHHPARTPDPHQPQ
ncbi:MULTISPECIES: ANTAR domain-containing protein [unclassified Streptomyces]|uniref:ANTAR domain-containing protein n=1 Tax=unclassified Streptomyces TaxID=2593676 RepID=UPI0036E83806